jgi:hypothetical protein
MITRISSWVVIRVVMLAIMAITISVFSSSAFGQGSSGYLTDPDTGIVYRKVTKTIETPVVETQLNSSEQTVYRPQTVTETRPHARTIYTPVVGYKLEPRVYGRWNPFRQPSVGYEHVPHTNWEARNEVVHRTNTRTQWVAERRTVETPTKVVRMQREQKVEFEPVGHVNQQQLGPSNPTDALASRLRPLDNPAMIQPFGQSSIYVAPRLASSTISGSYNASSPYTGSARTSTQEGLRPTDLAPTLPTGTVIGMPIDTTGIANSRTLPVYR